MIDSLLIDLRRRADRLQVDWAVIEFALANPNEG